MTKPEVTLGWQAKHILVRQSNGSFRVEDNPNYVENLETPVEASIEEDITGAVEFSADGHRYLHTEDGKVKLPPDEEVVISYSRPGPGEFDITVRSSPEIILQGIIHHSLGRIPALIVHKKKPWDPAGAPTDWQVWTHSGEYFNYGNYNWKQLDVSDVTAESFVVPEILPGFDYIFYLFGDDTAKKLKGAAERGEAMQFSAESAEQAEHRMKRPF
jgi:hypothetical protein